VRLRRAWGGRWSVVASHPRCWSASRGMIGMQGANMAAEQRVLPGALAVAAGTFGVVSLVLTWAWEPSVRIEPPGPLAPLVLSARVIGALGLVDAVLVLVVTDRWARTICTTAAFFCGAVALHIWVPLASGRLWAVPGGFAIAALVTPLTACGAWLLWAPARTRRVRWRHAALGLLLLIVIAPLTYVSVSAVAARPYEAMLRRNRPMTRRMPQ
jgi:hypothetical protein